jgi:hypothetical protein
VIIDRPRLLILTTLNVGFTVPRLTLLFGQINYGRTGMLDRTYTRLFRFRTLRRLLRDSGFQLRRMRGLPAPMPKAIGDNRTSRALTRSSPNLFSYQIFVSATVTPDVTYVLASTRNSVKAAAA